MDVDTVTKDNATIDLFTNTSAEAFESVPHAHLEGLAMWALRDNPDGLTADEAATIVGVTVLAMRPRFAFMHKTGYIADSGVRRKNVSGRKATVWVLTWPT